MHLKIVQSKVEHAFLAKLKIWQPYLAVPSPPLLHSKTETSGRWGWGELFLLLPFEFWVTGELSGEDGDVCRGLGLPSWREGPGCLVQAHANGDGPVVSCRDISEPSCKGATHDEPDGPCWRPIAFVVSSLHSNGLHPLSKKKVMVYTPFYLFGV